MRMTKFSKLTPFVILGVSGLFCCFYSIFDDVASDLGLHCLLTGKNGFKCQ